MNKLILLVMVLLFSATATGEENRKYKRGDNENMIMQLRCNHMANELKLSDARIDRHLQESMNYSLKIWESENPKKKTPDDDWADWYIAENTYQKGWVAGFFSALDAANHNGLYYSSCEDDQLLFSLVAK